MDAHQWHGLQWSHDLSAMDTRSWAWNRSFSRVSLQWSHGLSAMDTTLVTPVFDWSSVLQWSHGHSAMDTRRWWGVDTNIDYELQWSHDLSAMDTHRDYSNAGVMLDKHADTFNGAKTSQSWTPVNALNKVVQMHFELQWSHDLPAMDTTDDGLLAAQYMILQWSHDLSAMDTCDSRRRRGYRFRASMEP